MLQVTGLMKEFSSGDTKVIAVNNISFSVQTGAFVAIVGKSGSGKSTLLSLLGALEKPTSGSILVEEQDITKMSSRKLIQYRRKTIGFVFQGYNLIPNLSAIENVVLPMEFAGVSKSKAKQRTMELLEQVGIKGAKQLRKPTRLSGGEQQRVSIARALANKPELILADEPTGNLDSSTSRKIIELLHSLAKDFGTTVIIVTHDLNITKHTDITFQIQDGSLIEHNGHVEALVS